MFHEWLVRFVNVFVNPYSHLFYGYAPAALIWAWLSWRLGRAPERSTFLRYLLPKGMAWHPDVVLDLKILVLYQAMLPVLVPLTLAVALGAMAVGADLAGLVGSPALELPPLAAGVALCLCWDFAAYCGHRLVHTVPALWELHKVHHSAEVMTPLTGYRGHPLDRAIHAFVFPGAVTGFVAGVLPGAYLSDFKFVELWLLYVLSGLLGGALAHSHVWLSFGPYLGQVLVSPSFHHLHHSTREEHLHCNFGFTFALWDWLFGTMVLPGARESLRYGVDPADPNRGFVHTLLAPVARSVAALREALGDRRDSRTMWAIWGAMTLIMVVGAARAGTDWRALHHSGAIVDYGPDRLKNGDFQDGADDWIATMFEGMDRRGRLGLEPTGDGGLHILVTGLDPTLAAGRPWTARVAQEGLLSVIESRHLYELSFTAAADRANLAMEVGLQMRSPTFSPLVMKTLTLSDAPTLFALRFWAPVELDRGTEEIDLVFNLAFPQNAPDFRVTLRDVQLREDGASGALARWR